MVGLVVDAIFQVAYMFVTLNTYGGPGVILSLFFISVQVCNAPTTAYLKG